jgi:hypothetical protein
MILEGDFESLTNPLVGSSESRNLQWHLTDAEVCQRLLESCFDFKIAARQVALILLVCQWTLQSEQTTGLPAALDFD